MRASLIGATVLVALFAAAAFLDPLLEGLTATYFSDTAWTSSPVLSRVERQPSTDSILNAWSSAPPRSFSVTWTGSLVALRGGTYTIATESDDGSFVYVDGRLVVDNRGGHRARLKSGTLQLDRGVHSIFITYFEEGGGFGFHLLWARGGSELATIPAWALSVRPVEFARMLTSVVVRRGLGPIGTAWLVLLAALVAVERDRISRALEAHGTHPVRTCSLALALFVGLAVLHTWPLASNPAHLSRNDTGDALLNTWTIAWVSHQLPRDPRHLFDANIFYPEPRTLAYSESMIVQSVLAAPILALGGSPVLAYNLVLIAGFALTGWAFFLLVWRWTGSWSAALVGGSLAGFNAHVPADVAAHARCGLARRRLRSAGSDVGIPDDVHRLARAVRGGCARACVAAGAAVEDDRAARLLGRRGGRRAGALSGAVPVPARGDRRRARRRGSARALRLVGRLPGHRITRSLFTVERPVLPRCARAELSRRDGDRARCPRSALARNSERCAASDS